MFGFEDLFILIVAGLFGPFLASNRTLGLPVVAGEILGGILFGESGLGLIKIHNETLIFLANFGFALLLFQVGTRLPVAHVFRGVSGSAKRGIFAAVWTFALAIPMGLVLSHFSGIGHPVMFILLGAASSTSTVFPALSERRVVGDQASALTTWIPTDDIGTMVLLPLAFGIGSSPEIMLGCGIVAATGLVCFLGIKKFRETEYGKRMRKLSKDLQWILDMRVMVLVLAGLAILAQRFGTSVLIAGFVAGVMSNLLKQPKRLNKQTSGLAEGLLVPVFFVYIGARIDLHELFTSVANLELAAMVVVAGLIVHMAAAKLSGLRLSTGMIASQHMGLPAAIVSMGLSVNAITSGQAAAILTASLISLAVCLYGIRHLPTAPLVEKPQEAPGDQPCTCCTSCGKPLVAKPVAEEEDDDES